MEEIKKIQQDAKIKNSKEHNKIKDSDTGKTNTILIIMVTISILVIIYNIAVLVALKFFDSSVTNINDKTEININENDILDDKNVNNNIQDISDNSNSDGGILFIVGEYDGKVAIFNNEKTVIYEVFDVYVNTLPKYDVNELANGIPVYNTEELYSLIEDFTS